MSIMAGLNSRRRDLYSAAALFLLTVLLLSRFLFTIPTPYVFPTSGLGTDLSREVLPPIYYTLNSLHQTGELPLWRTYLLSGTPLIGHPVIPVLYPPHWLVLFLPVPLALLLDLLFHLWWLALGMYLCLRYVSGVRWIAAFMGGLLFGHLPLIIAQAGGGHWSTISAIAWFPWLWLAFHLYWKTNRLPWAILLGVSLAGQALNDGKYLYICGLCVAVCTLGYFQPNLRWLKRAVLLWLVALVIMVGLTAGQLFPLADLLSQSDRSVVDFDLAAAGQPLILFLFNTFFPENLVITELFLFPGVGALLLALYDAATETSKRLWWIAGIVVITLISSGSNTPLYGLLYAVVPGFKGFRGPERWFPVALFGIVTLAAYGLDRWLSTPTTSKWTKPILIGVALSYCLVALFQVISPGIMPYHVSVHFIIAIVIAGILIFGRSFVLKHRWALAMLILLTLGGVWLEDFNLIYPQSVTEAEKPDAITTFLEGNIGAGERVFFPYAGSNDTVLTVNNIPTADGWDPTVFSTYADFMRHIGGCNVTFYVVGAPPTRADATAAKACPQFRPDMTFLKLLNIRDVILPTSVPNEGPNLKQVFSTSGYNIYDTGGGYGRAFGVSRITTVSPEQCMDQLDRIDSHTEALSEVTLPTLNSGNGDGSADVSEQGQTANSEIFTVNARSGGLLVRSETWADGWTATIDGKDVPVYKVDCTLQGVQFDAGEHTIRFDYLPKGYLIGRWLFIPTGILILCFLLREYYLVRRGTTPHQDAA